MKILFVWRKYNETVGGVERISIALMNEMIKRGHEITLLSWDQESAKTYYELDSRVKWYKLNLGDPDQKASWGLRFRRAIKIRKIIKDISPDVAIAFMDGVFLSTKLSILGLDIPVIEAERCSTARFKYLKSGSYVFFIFQSLRLAKNITIQLESYRKDYPKFLHSRIVSISNPVPPSNSYAKPLGIPNEKKILLSVGRISYQKNYTVLVSAFKQLADEFPDWNLKIIGDGEEKKDLQKIIDKLDLREKVILIDSTPNVSDFYCNSHLFCLPSRWEGFPNALAEALAHGLPAVGFNECLGVCDLIQHGKNGLLAPGIDDQESLAATLRVLMKDNEKREEMGRQAVISMQPYRPEIIFEQWEKFFIKSAQ